VASAASGATVIATGASVGAGAGRRQGRYSHAAQGQAATDASNTQRHSQGHNSQYGQAEKEKATRPRRLGDAWLNRVLKNADAAFQHFKSRYNYAA